MFISLTQSKKCSERYLMCNIPKKIIASGCHFFKKIDEVLWRITWEVGVTLYFSIHFALVVIQKTKNGSFVYFSADFRHSKVRKEEKTSA